MPAISKRPGQGPIDPVLDVQAVSRILRRDPHTVRIYFREGKIPGAKRLAGGRWIILQLRPRRLSA